MKSHRARNGPFTAALVALVMLCALFIGFIASTSIEVMTNNNIGTMVVDSTAQTAFVSDIVASSAIKEAHGDAIFHNTSANTDTAITTAPLTEAAVNIRITKNQTPVSSRAITSPPAQVANDQMARNGIYCAATIIVNATANSLV